VRRPSAPPPLRRQQWPDDRPLFVSHPDPLTQSRISIQTRP
jgi:hypothetical protein